MAEVIDLESPGLAAVVSNVGDRPKASRGAGCSAEEVCVVDDDDDDDVQPIKVLDEAPSSRRERASPGGDVCVIAPPPAARPTAGAAAGAASSPGAELQRLREENAALKRAVYELTKRERQRRRASLETAVVRPMGFGTSSGVAARAPVQN